MLCERCHGREAVVHITEIINGHKTDQYLCRECAEKENAGTAPLNFFDHDFFYDKFDSLFDGGFMRPFFDSPLTAVENLYAPDTLRTGLKQGDRRLFAKPGSYENLMRHLTSPSSVEVGKTGKEPLSNGVGKNGNSSDQLLILQKRLEQLVAEEKYEEAAKVRDEINKLKK